MLNEDFKTRTHIIYKFTNRINGKSYIGQTRRSFILRYPSGKPHENDSPLLVQAYKEFGKEAFEIQIIESDIPTENLSNREIYYIAYYNTMSPNGYNLTEGGRCHKSVSLETIKKSKKSQRRRFLKNYLLIRDKKEYIFYSIAEFAEEHGLSRSCVSLVLSGKQKSVGGFHLPGTDMETRNRKDKNRRWILEKNGILFEIANLTEFCRENNLVLGSIRQIFEGKVIEHEGFHLPNKRKHRKANNGRKYWRLIFKKDGIEIDLKTHEEIDIFLHKNKIHLSALTTGKSGNCYGYFLIKAFDKLGNEIKIKNKIYERKPKIVDRKSPVNRGPNSGPPDSSIL